MNGLVIRWLVNALALLLTSYIVKGITVQGLGSALIAAAVLGIVNAVIRPLFLLFTLPLNILTLGLLTFIINGVMLLLVSGMVPGFEVRGLWSAVLGSIVLSLISAALSSLVRR